MIIFYCGAGLLVAGSIAVAVIRHRADDQSIETLLDKIRPLSPQGKDALEEASGCLEPLAGELSLEDTKTLFFNSKICLRIANRARLCDPYDSELISLLGLLQEDHRLLWRLVLMKFFGLPLHGRSVLWIYAEELEILSQMSDKCGDVEGNAIRAIL